MDAKMVLVTSGRVSERDMGELSREYFLKYLSFSSHLRGFVVETVSDGVKFLVSRMNPRQMDVDYDLEFLPDGRLQVTFNLSNVHLLPATREMLDYAEDSQVIVVRGEPDLSASMIRAFAVPHLSAYIPAATDEKFKKWEAMFRRELGVQATPALVVQKVREYMDGRVDIGSLGMHGDMFDLSADQLVAALDAYKFNPVSLRLISGGTKQVVHAAPFSRHAYAKVIRLFSVPQPFSPSFSYPDLDQELTAEREAAREKRKAERQARIARIPNPMDDPEFDSLSEAEKARRMGEYLMETGAVRVISLNPDKQTPNVQLSVRALGVVDGGKSGELGSDEG